MIANRSLFCPYGSDTLAPSSDGRFFLGHRSLLLSFHAAIYREFAALNRRKPRISPGLRLWAVPYTRLAPGQIPLSTQAVTMRLSLAGVNSRPRDYGQGGRTFRNCAAAFPRVPVTDRERP